MLDFIDDISECLRCAINAVSHLRNSFRVNRKCLAIIWRTIYFDFVVHKLRCELRMEIRMFHGRCIVQRASHKCHNNFRVHANRWPIESAGKIAVRVWAHETGQFGTEKIMRANIYAILSIGKNKLKIPHWQAVAASMQQQQQQQWGRRRLQQNKKSITFTLNTLDLHWGEVLAPRKNPNSKRNELFKCVDVSVTIYETFGGYANETHRLVIVKHFSLFQFQFYVVWVIVSNCTIVRCSGAAHKVCADD